MAEPITTALTIASAAKSIAGLFGGKGKTPSVLQGFAVDGTFGPSGFSGSVMGGDQLGNRWTGTGEQAYLNSLGRGLVQFTSSTYLPDAEIDRYFSEGGAPIRVQLGLPADASQIPRQVGDSIIATIKESLKARPVVAAGSMNMQAPTIAAGDFETAARRIREAFPTWSGSSSREVVESFAGTADRFLAQGGGPVEWGYGPEQNRLLAELLPQARKALEAPAPAPSSSSASLADAFAPGGQLYATAPAVTAPSSSGGIQTASPAALYGAPTLFGAPLELVALAAAAIGGAWWLTRKRKG